MALVERLCQVDLDEPGGEPSERHIALNPFCEALFSILGGYVTVSQLKAFYNMTPEDEAELDTFVDRILAYSATSNQNLRERAVHRVRGILTFWEQGDIPGYMTVANIRSQLNTV